MGYKNICLTTENLYFHDCEINSVQMLDKSIIFQLEWLYVLKTHPLNKTGKSKVSRKPMLIFENASEVHCSNGKKIVDCCSGKEILDAEEILVKEKKIWKVFCCNRIESISFKISYSSMRVCFNDLEEDAWFDSLNN